MPNTACHTPDDPGRGPVGGKVLGKKRGVGVAVVPTDDHQAVQPEVRRNLHSGAQHSHAHRSAEGKLDEEQHKKCG